LTPGDLSISASRIRRRFFELTKGVANGSRNSLN